MALIQDTEPHATRRDGARGISEKAASQPAAPQRAAGVPTYPVRFTLNGSPVELEVDARTTLLDALRQQLQMSGTKKGCDHGQCGACTVLLGVGPQRRRINACLTLAVMHEGDTLTTIEGLGTAQSLHPLQRAFLEHDGFQCGYCTAGQICSAQGMLDEFGSGAPSHASPTLTGALALDDAEIRERMSGNLCRCAAYPNIVAAIAEVAGAAVAEQGGSQKTDVAAHASRPSAPAPRDKEPT